MLEMCRRLAVTGTNRPAVFVEPDVALAHRNHRFDGYAHGGFQHCTITTPTVVGHWRVFVHLPAYAVSSELANDAILMVFAVILDGGADVTQMVTGLCGLDTEVEGLLRDLQQLRHFLADLAHTERVAGVAVESVKQRTAVNRDDVTLLQHRLLIGHSMNDDIIYRSTDAGGKRPSIRIGETFEGRNGSMVTDELIGYLVQMEGRYTRLDMFCQFAKGLSNQLVGLAHQLYLIFSLQVYLHRRRLVSLHAAAVDTTGAEQTVIVAHQQVRLNLCEGVEHHTDENEERRTTEEL